MNKNKEQKLNTNMIGFKSFLIKLLNYLSKKKNEDSDILS